MEKKKKIDPFEKRRARGPQNFSVNLDHIVKTLGGKYGFSEVDLLQNWGTIVGERYADIALPMKIKFPQKERRGGTLFIRLTSGAAATLLAHQTPILLEKINTFFGYRAISKLQFTS